ncbi:MAG: 2TM domain-containing protein [Saprospiraceae bacterium]
MDKNTVAYIKAEKRVKEVKSFYKTLFMWLSVSCFLLALNFFTNRHEFWSIYPILGMSLGLAIKYARVFGWPGFGKEWEERQFYEELERIQEREERIRMMLNKEKTITGFTNSTHQNTLNSPGNQPLKEEMEKLELKELRKQWRDSDLV